MPKKSQTSSPSATSSPAPKESMTESRKRDHIQIALEKDVQYSRATGLERAELLHNALPEVDFDAIDLSMEFLGKKIAYPLLISAMTGGYPEAKRINEELATAAEKHKMAFALGSQRSMLENPSLRETYCVRPVAPSIPVIGNIGAIQLKRYPVDKVLGLVSAIEADALAVHLNPLQEAVQPEGDRDFSGVLAAIGKLCEKSDVPIIAKETGTGISQDVALRLKEAGVAWIDVAGAGGTSWSKVEYARNGATPGFGEWGIPTLDSLVQCRGVLPMIASGGLRSGIDAAKCVALGAELAGAAYPFLKALDRSQARLDETISLWEAQMKKAAFLSGCRTRDELKKAKMVLR
jgi:isopentenyl-diphosphate delta-isomerase